MLKGLELWAGEVSEYYTQNLLDHFDLSSEGQDAKKNQTVQVGSWSFRREQRLVGNDLCRDMFYFDNELGHICSHPDKLSEAKFNIYNC